MLARAQTYVECANTVPLILHIHEEKDIDYDNDDIETFLASLATRIKSLNFTVIDYWGEFTESFNSLLPGCASGLSELKKPAVTFIGNSHHPHFTPIEPTGNFSSGGLQLPLLQSVIEDSFRNLSVLHLRGLFPSWTSAVYHNLVDLRLIAHASSVANWHRIPESEFMGILEASPRLRILYFALDIASKKPQDSSMIPVYLEDLEVVNIATHHDLGREDLEPGNVLRLLAPGSKPLQLSVWHHGSYGEDEFPAKQLRKFFERSNVTRFYGKEWCLPLNELLSYAHKLQDLALCSSSFRFDSVPDSPEKSTSVLNLNSLTLHGWFHPPFEKVDLLLQRHLTRTVILLGCTLPAEWDEAEFWDNHPNTDVLEGE